MSRIETTGAAGAAAASTSHTTPAEKLTAVLEMKVPKGDRQATRLRLGAIFRVLNSVSVSEANTLLEKIGTEGDPLRDLLSYKLSKPLQDQVIQKLVDIGVHEKNQPAQWEKMWPLNKDEIALLDAKQPSSLKQAMTPSTSGPAQQTEQSFGEMIRGTIAKAKKEAAANQGAQGQSGHGQGAGQSAGAGKSLGDVVRGQIDATKAAIGAEASAKAEADLQRRVDAKTAGLMAALDRKVPRGDGEATRLRLGAIFREMNSMSVDEAMGVIEKIGNEGDPLREKLFHKLSKPMQDQVLQKFVDIAVHEKNKPAPWEQKWPLTPEEEHKLNTSMLEDSDPADLAKGAGKANSSSAADAAAEARHAEAVSQLEDSDPADLAGGADGADGDSGASLADIARAQVEKTKAELRAKASQQRRI